MEQKEIKRSAGFAKGRIGEEIIKQWFSKNRYTVLPTGIEHTNFQALYDCHNEYKYNDEIFLRMRKLPDFCLIKNKRFIYVEAKYRAKRYEDIGKGWVIATILKSYFDRKDGRFIHNTHVKQIENIIMIWFFENEIRGLRVGNVIKNIENIIENISNAFDDELIENVASRSDIDIDPYWGDVTKTPEENWYFSQSDWNDFVKEGGKILNTIFK